MNNRSRTGRGRPRSASIDRAEAEGAREHHGEAPAPPLVPDHRLAALDPLQAQRHTRTIGVPEIGAVGQRRISAARVLLVGAGGLGSAVTLYLAAAGVGSLGIVDPDVVEVSNLQRQVMHTQSALGLAKVDSARAAVAALNPAVRVVTHRTAVDADNAVALMEGWDVVVDATDSFAARYLLSDTAARLGVPLVHGAVHGTHGQVAVFDPRRGPCYRCLVPQPPAPNPDAPCPPGAVLGAVAGVVGALQAVEALKLIVGGGRPLMGRLLLVETWDGRIREIAVRKLPGCPTCAG